MKKLCLHQLSDHHEKMIVIEEERRERERRHEKEREYLQGNLKLSKN